MDWLWIDEFRWTSKLKWPQKSGHNIATRKFLILSKYCKQCIDRILPYWSGCGWWSFEFWKVDHSHAKLYDLWNNKYYEYNKETKKIWEISISTYVNAHICFLIVFSIFEQKIAFNVNQNFHHNFICDHLFMIIFLNMCVK